MSKQVDNRTSRKLLAKALTIPEIAAVAGVSEPCMRKRVERAGVHPIRIVGRMKLYAGEAVAGLCYPARIWGRNVASDTVAGHIEEAGVETRRKGTQ